jgi:hypothetical protein
MRTENSWRQWAAALSIWTAVSVLILAAGGPAEAAHFGAAVSPNFDRGYKVGLLERLPSPPQLVIFGGSRAQRFDPSYAEELTGLSTFNFAVQNSRPEDVYTMSRLLFWRAPNVRLRCIWALQTSTISDSPLHPGLLAETELTKFLPDDLVREQRRLVASTKGRELPSWNEFTPRGRLLRNTYDFRLDRGVSFATTLSGYLARMVPRAGSSSPYGKARAKKYFERTLRLFNLHGVEPVLVIMPYHPAALAAFRAAGWEAKEDAFVRYLDSLRARYRFRLVDYTDIAAFHGVEDGFYDGAHVTVDNSRRILEQVVTDEPDAFR